MKALILILVICLCVPAVAQINDIFIGNFLTYDPYLLPPVYLTELMPEYDNERLFIWIENKGVFDTTMILNRVSPVVATLYSSIHPINHHGNLLQIDTKIHFIFNDQVYNTRIECFLYSDIYENKADIFAVCVIPKELKGTKLLSSDTFPIICSTSKDIQIIYNKFEVQDSIEVVSRVGDYVVLSYLEDTGLKGKYTEPVYKSYVKVLKNNEVVYDTERQYYPFQYYIGDFNGNGKLDLYIFHHPWDRIHWIIEFDNSEYHIKKYVQICMS